VTPEEEIGPEITPEEQNYIQDEGMALQLLCDFLHVRWSDIKDGKVVLVGGKTTEDEARRALCRILSNEKWGPSGEVLEALVEVFDPDATKAALKAVLKRRNRGHANPYADHAIADAVSLLRLGGKHYDDAIAEVADKFGKSAEHVKRIFGKDGRPIAKRLPRLPRRKSASLFLRLTRKKWNVSPSSKRSMKSKKAQDVACATSCALLLFPLIRATIIF
jgi:hypothetical protein